MTINDLESQTFRAVRAYGRGLNDRLAGNIVHMLRRAKAVGAYDEYWHRTRWDEFCHEWQEGPHGQLRTAWERDIHPYLDFYANKLPHDEQLLLTAAAIWEHDDLDNYDELAICPELIQRGIMQALVERAMARDLSQFDPR